MNEKNKRAVLSRIENAKDSLTYAEEAMEKGDVDEVENQLDIAADECGQALSIAKHLNDEKEPTK